jgi:hypothetical protein
MDPTADRLARGEPHDVEPPRFVPLADLEPVEVTLTPTATYGGGSFIPAAPVAQYRGGVATADEMAETLWISPEQVHLYVSRGYAVAVGWQPLESGRAAVDFRRVAVTTTRRRESHARRPGHRRTRSSARAGPGSSDDPPGESPGPALALAPRPRAIYHHALSRCPSCGAVLLWSDGRLVCATRSCERWGSPA